MKNLVHGDGRLGVYFWSEWQFTKVNWIEMTVVYLHGEVDYYCQIVEILVSLVGFNLRIAWYYGRQAFQVQEEPKVSPQP